MLAQVGGYLAVLAHWQVGSCGSRPGHFVDGAGASPMPYIAMRRAHQFVTSLVQNPRSKKANRRPHHTASWTSPSSSSSQHAIAIIFSHLRMPRSRSGSLSDPRSFRFIEPVLSLSPVHAPLLLPSPEVIRTSYWPPAFPAGSLELGNLADGQHHTTV